jgi:hypothetical protein
MSKIFVNENPQPLTRLRPQLAQGHDSFKVLVDQVRGRKRAWPVTPTSRHDGFAVVGGTIMLGALGIVVYLWHKELLLAAAVFVLLGTFARSPIFAIGGALLLLLLAR